MAVPRARHRTSRTASPGGARKRRAPARTRHERQDLEPCDTAKTIGKATTSRIAAARAAACSGGGGGGIPIPIGGGGLSITSLLVIGVICLMLGINPLELLSGARRHAAGCRTCRAPVRARGSPFEIPGGQQPRVAPQDDEMTRFVRRVLADTEDVWERVFQAAGKTLREADAGAVHARHAARPAASANRRWGRSIARSTTRSTSISTSTGS